MVVGGGDTSEGWTQTWNDSEKSSTVGERAGKQVGVDFPISLQVSWPG